MKKKLSISFILSLFGVIGGYFTARQTLESGTLPIPEGTPLMLITIVQTGVLTFLLSLAGLSMLKHTPFTFKSKSGFGLSVVLGALVGLILAGSDAVLFSRYLPTLTETEPTFSLMGLLMGVFYGGVVEEVMMRLFLMTLIVFLTVKITKKKEFPSFFYWGVIFIVSILFGIGHLPANFMLFGELSPLIVGRALLLNGIGGLVFGYLYWKHGFIAAVVSHMSTHIFMQLLFIPLLY